MIAQSRLLGHPTVLSLMCAEACFAFLWYFWLSWMPSFFHDVYDLSTGDAGTLGMMIYWVGMPAPGQDVAKEETTLDQRNPLHFGSFWLNISPKDRQTSTESTAPSRPSCGAKSSAQV